MDAVMISIRPEWCELIASRKKRIELRKTRPRIDTPFKCYIYETRGDVRVGNDNLNCTVRGKGRGAVIGEFICTSIYKVDVPFPAYQADMDKWTRTLLADAALTYTQAHDYLGHRSGYGWLISDLKIYDEPKALTDFFALCPRVYCQDTCPQWKHHNCDLLHGGVHPINSPPQSWCYVEELA